MESSGVRYAVINLRIKDLFVGYTFPRIRNNRQTLRYVTSFKDRFASVGIITIVRVIRPLAVHFFLFTKKPPSVAVC